MALELRTDIQIPQTAVVKQAPTTKQEEVRQPAEQAAVDKDTTSLTPQSPKPVNALNFQGAKKSNPIDFAAFFNGLSGGDKMGIDGGTFIGGDGAITEMTSDSVKMTLHLDLPWPVKDKDLNIEVKRQPDGSYKMLSPKQWDLDITVKGNTMTMSNRANAGESFAITNVKPGELKVKTHGLGYDKTTLEVAKK